MTALQLTYKMLRPRVAYILLMFAALGIAQGGYKHQLAWQYLVIAVIVASWYINATSVNDLADYEIDRINLKGATERPLANEEVGRGQILWLSIFSAATALITGFIMDWKIGVIVAVCLFLNYLYSMPPVRLSYRGALAPLMLPIGYVLLPYLVGVWSVHENITHNGWLILEALYISFIGRIILKDFRDVKGDAKFGKLTFILRYGRRATCIASALGLIIGSSILLAVIPHQIVIITAFEAVLICTLFGLYKLYGTRGRGREQIIIGSVVRAASGVVIMLLAVLLIQNSNKSLSEQVLVTAVLGLFFIAMFWDSISRSTKLGAKA